MPAPDFLHADHRKTVRHFDLPGDAHFLTFSCIHRLPLLSKDRTRKWLVEAIGSARIEHCFDLWAWVIMPEHVHLLIYPRSTDYSISAILSTIKRPVGERAVAYLRDRRSPYLEKLCVRARTRTRYHFWQAGPGYDHNVYDPTTAHRIVEYIHDNPIRGGLVTRSDDWKWSSARDWLGHKDVQLCVDRTLPPVLEIPSEK